MTNQPLFLFASLALILLAIPLIRRRVPPNRLYGVRIPATFADEWVWYEANARSGWDLLWLGLTLLSAALLLPFLGLREGTSALVWTAALLAGTLVLAGVAIRRANRLLREREAETDDRF